jgi:flagellar biosynthesis/type III secretory pathway protein FliH
MAALTENDPRIIETHREFLRFNANPQTRELARQRELFLVDYHLGMAASKSEGYTKGYAEGYAKGYAKGCAEVRAEVALKLKRYGMDNKTIMKITSLSLSKIKGLK